MRFDDGPQDLKEAGRRADKCILDKQATTQLGVNNT
ncbi:hypothetical protein S7711_10851 [Stachybotrys chartarum IBT 7711]|uniref:Uncharacterized protein n=1 Tax=Stachybotrys chartarum (strain CBS 109288 / IBT 7711) TaxID=1280523 RepID=A0A084BA78_STACB|nr:hypothetical protein S7711_10851 [Stachybotrys chartarum IBT 7711]KFA54543.1 hypothetical protein S40293_11236 [Stachybotrys chartarum IBT 40293]